MKRWLVAKETGVTDDSTQLLWGEGSENISQELRLLREALGGVDFDPSLYKEDARSLVEEILRDVEAMCASFAYYFKSGEQHSINSAAYLLPPGLPGAVVLDATALNDTLYQLLGLHIADVPPNVRRVSERMCKQVSVSLPYRGDSHDEQPDDYTGITGSTAC